MSRIQIFIFSALLTISLVFILLNENADLYLSNRCAAVLLLPIRIYFNYFQYLEISQKKIDHLESELSRLNIENQMFKNRLGLLSSSDNTLSNQFRILKANIIGRDPQNFNGFLYIDKGKNDSITTNAPVILQNKIVGRVKSVFSDIAIVETFENSDFAISGKDVRSGIYGIVKKKRQLLMEYIKINDNVTIGDSIYTSGLSDIFPEGLLIGVVSDVREKKGDLFFKEVIIEPAISINRLNYVYVIY
ncbi:MAG: rod shape-determining protein MreC [candidate division WOR-3 bacterium]|nr:rod shape-determining protein MreC [candidate division WOR-3 bacterium]